MLNSIPPFCTGVGVFLTFLVLYFELGQITAESDINKIVGNLSGAFSSSLVGILAGLLTAPIVKYRISTLEEKQYLRDKPQSVINAINQHPHELLFEQNNLTQQIIAATNRQNQTLASLIEAASGISDDLNKKIGKTLENIQQSTSEELVEIGKLSITTAQEQVKTINEVFTDSAKTILKQNLRHFNSISKDFKEELAETKEELASIRNEINGNLLSVKNDFSVNSAAIANEMQKNIEAQVNEKNSVLKALSESEEKTKEHLQNISTAVDEKVENFNQVAERIKSETENSTKVIQDYLNNLNATVAEQTEDIFNKNIIHLENAFSKLKSYQASAHSNLEQTTGQFADAVNKYQKSTDNNAEILKLIRQEAANTKNLIKQTSAIAQQHAELLEAVEKMNNRINDLANAQFAQSEI